MAKGLARFLEGGGRGEQVRTHVIKGHAKEAILDEAERFGADLIMIGTHGYNALERAWLGSVSRAIAAHAGCSVEIVRPPVSAADSAVTGGMRLLVAVDGSPFGEAAVAEIARRPWPAGTEVRAVTAIHLPFVPTPETWILPEDYYAEAERVSREQAEKILARAEEILRTAGSELSFSGEAILGHAEEVILAVAREKGRSDPAWLTRSSGVGEVPAWLSIAGGGVACALFGGDRSPGISNFVNFNPYRAYWRDNGDRNMTMERARRASNCREGGVER